MGEEEGRERGGLGGEWRGGEEEGRAGVGRKGRVGMYC